jgi:uncharacterized protein
MCTGEDDMPNPVVHFEIPANDCHRAEKFYESVFDWDIKYLPEWDYWSVVTADKKGPGINGGMMKKKHPQQPFMAYISVDDVQKYLDLVVKAGGAVALPRTPLGTGALGAFKDTEGNIVGLHEEGKPAPAKTKSAKKRK